MAVPIIEMRDVQKYYVLDGIQVHALRGINLTVESGDYVSIIGPSGSGKSTLMNIIGCLDIPDEGRYNLNGKDVTKMDPDQLAEIRNKYIGFVFQSFNLLARTSALENVETPMIYSGIDKATRKERARVMLERIGLGHRLQNYPTQLSGGQQQRVAIARALVTNPVLILADEPTGNVDTATTHEILSIFDDLNKDGITILLITHEPEVAQRAKRTLTVRDGRLE